ncbi:phage major capsid protein [Georgenia wangjunii]|uniref:phage major capsid protein n=1 Tax=Georgenia wangjunii TaxID=3117730 RepID=UPI002F269644
MDPKQKRDAAIAAAQTIVKAAQDGRRDLTADERKKVEGHLTEAREAKKIIDDAKSARDLIAMLAAQGGDDYDGDDWGDGDAGPRGKGGKSWGKSIAAGLTGKRSPLGTKALLTGPVRVPAAVDLADAGTPTPGGRLLDLIPRKELTDGNTFEYLKQTAKTNNAAPVADGATKPTSVYSFEAVEDRARVVAHLSEPIPIRFLGLGGERADVEGLGELLDGQMLTGVLEVLEGQLVNGNGTGENFPGLLNVSGVTDVAFSGDELTTIRHARTVLEGKGERPTAWVFHPDDVERLDLMRETADGGFLLNSSAADVLFGAGVARLQSLAVPAGTAILADWSTTRLRIRRGAHTLAATQGSTGGVDLFATNQARLRSEGRFGIEWRRPQALAVVHLAA